MTADQTASRYNLMTVHDRDKPDIVRLACREDASCNLYVAHKVIITRTGT